MNEELSSSNEELQTINDELRDRTNELGQMSAYMESILTSIRAGVIVVDRELHVRLWNGRSFDMWGLRADEVEGRAILSLDIGLPVEELAPALQAALSGAKPAEPVVLDARDRRGRSVKCRVSLSPLTGPSNAVDGVILLVNEAE